MRHVGRQDYNLATRNCENFATWCVYGISASDQIRGIAGGAGTVAATGVGAGIRMGVGAGVGSAVPVAGTLVGGCAGAVIGGGVGFVLGAAATTTTFAVKDFFAEETENFKWLAI